MADWTRISAALVVSGGAAACSIHPLPDDVTGYSTIDIVARVRCEVREALSESVVAFLSDSSHSAKNRRIAEKLKQTDPADRYALYKQFYENKYSGIDNQTAKYFDIYDTAAIAYDFTFEIKQENKTNLGAGLTDPFSNGLLAVGLAAGNERTRKGTRNFRISDTFRALLTEDLNKYCRGQAKGQNWQYPIAGKIGLAETIDTFIALNELGALVNQKDQVPTLADVLEFETTISGSVNPVLLLTPAGGNVANRLRLGGASATESASRRDLHRVQVAISLPPDPATDRKSVV